MSDAVIPETGTVPTVSPDSPPAPVAASAPAVQPPRPQTSGAILAPVAAEVPEVPEVAEVQAPALPVAEQDAEAVVNLGEVYPGDVGEGAYLVVRSISGRDDGIYDEQLVEFVKVRQAEAGLEPTGIISGATWGLVLPRVDSGTLGQARDIALNALRVKNTRYDDEVIELVKQIQTSAGLEPTGVIDKDTWLAIIG